MRKRGSKSDNVFHVGHLRIIRRTNSSCSTTRERVLVGADIELAKILAEKLGKELKITNMSFDGLLGSLAEGQFDCVIAGLTNDPEREVLFSDNYYSRFQTCIVRKEALGDFASIDSLAGKKIAGQTGTVQETLAKDYAGASAIAVQNFNDMIMMLQGGQLDGIISDSDVAKAFVATNKDITLVEFDIPYENDATAIAFKLGNQELYSDQVNVILAELLADGTIDQLMNDAMALQEELAIE